MPTFISLGQYCRPAMNLRRRGAHVIFPFDVISTTDVNMIRECIESDFAGFLDMAEYENLEEKHWRHRRYGFDFYHDTRANPVNFVKLYTPRLENFRQAIRGPVVFVREGAALADFERLLDAVPRSHGILVNHAVGPFCLRQNTERVREWVIPGTSAANGDFWPHETWLWDIILESGEWP